VTSSSPSGFSGRSSNERVTGARQVSG
jgi:hypothetical protein